MTLSEPIALPVWLTGSFINIDQTTLSMRSTKPGQLYALSQVIRSALWVSIEDKKTLAMDGWTCYVI